MNNDHVWAMLEDADSKLRQLAEATDRDLVLGEPPRDLTRQSREEIVAQLKAELGAAAVTNPNPVDGLNRQQRRLQARGKDPANMPERKPGRAAVRGSR